MKTLPIHPRHLTPEEIERLEKNGCRSADWSSVRISKSDLDRISFVEFVGEVVVGRLSSEGGGLLSYTRLEDVVIEDEAVVSHVAGGIKGCRIGAGAKIENVARIEFEKENECGAGILINVLDETGSRPVMLYPGLCSAIAHLAAFYPKWGEEKLARMLRDEFEESGFKAGIGSGAIVRDCGVLHNVSIWPEVVVEGAVSLRNGMVINNAGAGKCMASIGAGVNADGFIIEDGKVESCVLLRNVYVGQGARLGNGFTAHDSLFFSNCNFENGEACAVLSGPYTVSMHKSSLLIGGIYSFMNVGSGSNASNHGYKLGPVHWGIMQRGVKTSSNAYIMWGAKVGAFSLLIGDHKFHPDTSSFPFSYLIGDERGETVVVPGIMLKSCGLMRDEKKWIARDHRLHRRLSYKDNIIFDILNPFTIGAVSDALDLIGELKSRLPDADRYYRFNGLKLRASSLDRAERLYRAAICKYISLKFPDCKIMENEGAEEAEDWVDLGGQLIPRGELGRLLEASSAADLRQILDELYEEYPELERRWIIARLGKQWRERESEVLVYASEFDRNIEEDRRIYKAKLRSENEMLRL